ncbi:MAG TPA: family 16 glycoside hydrolase [Chryseosolibacter sp.]
MKKILFAFLFGHTIAVAQVVPFTSDRWKFATSDYSLETYNGKEAVKLKKNSAMLEGAAFENGTIEYDMAFPQGRAFIGFHFRIADEKNYEEFYVRPHQSGNPDANQYTPVFGSNAGWQLYYGEGYGAPAKYDFNNWIHFKLIVSGQYMEVYINDMETPVIFAELKRKPLKGNVGIQNAINESYFANVSVTPNDNVVLKNKPKPAQAMAPGTIEKWAVSNAFARAQLNTITKLSDLPVKLTYASHKVEPTGTLNISSVAELGETSDAVLAKLVIESTTDQVKKIQFGFSDRVKVFVNNVVVYSGEDDFSSRDYRFLGTIGYFDALYLQLRKGRNEIHFAVIESFGGWGIKARIEDMSGIKIIY